VPSKGARRDLHLAARAAKAMLSHLLDAWRSPSLSDSERELLRFELHDARKRIERYRAMARSRSSDPERRAA
jgi:hypothetical protein